MSRKNIFDILAERNDVERDVDRIEYLFDSENLLCKNKRSDYTIKEFVTNYCFDTWHNRGHCLDLDDFLETLGYDEYCFGAKNGNVEDFFAFVEIVFNCWKMAEIYMLKNEEIQYYDSFYLLFNIMCDSLSHYNHKAVYDEGTEQVLVIEDDPAVTAVAEIVEPKLSLDILKYNHYTLRGNIDKKKAILLALGAELEPKRKTLAGINSTLEDRIFFMLNNLNLRHNNMSPDDKNYKEFVAKMDSETLENWYDELYQMILLAFLEIDQIERNSRVKTLKANINGGKR